MNFIDASKINDRQSSSYEYTIKLLHQWLAAKSNDDDKTLSYVSTHQDRFVYIDVDDMNLVECSYRIEDGDLLVEQVSSEDVSMSAVDYGKLVVEQYHKAVFLISLNESEKASEIMARFSDAPSRHALSSYVSDISKRVRVVHDRLSLIPEAQADMSSLVNGISISSTLGPSWKSKNYCFDDNKSALSARRDFFRIVERVKIFNEWSAGLPLSDKPSLDGWIDVLASTKDLFTEISSIVSFVDVSDLEMILNEAIDLFESVRFSCVAIEGVVQNAKS